MSSRIAPLAALTLTVLLGSALAQGPDVIVGDITGPSNYAADATHDAFAMGTTSCNIGTTPLTWIANNNQHPVIGYSLHRIHEGRFLQVGQSWLKHGFFALQQNLCGGCQPNPNGSALGVGCSDPYGSGLNGQQADLGPKYQVNASTGAFPYPPANPTWSGSTARRCRVPLGLLDAPGAVFVAEAQYIQPEDAMNGSDDNNASYRLASVSGGPTNYALSYAGPTVRELPAIYAWSAVDPGVSIQTVDVPGAMGGRFVVAMKRTDNGNGTWHFECAVLNLNSHDSAASFTVNFANTTITNQGFYAPEWHSGEVFDNNVWTPMAASNGATWMVDMTFAQNPNSNALRWGTTYSFWFDSTDPDPTGSVLGLYRSAGSESVPAPTFPTPEWQANQTGASLDVDGATHNPFVGPIQVSAVSGTPHVVNIDGAAGAVHELFLASTPGIPNNLVTPEGQILNLDYLDSSFAPFGIQSPMPNGGYQIPFNAAATQTFVSAQLYVVDPSHPEGMRLSALTELSMGPAPRIIVECVGDNSFNAITTSGFWRVISTGASAASVTSVTFDFSNATGPAAGDFFDTNQGQMAGVFNQGTTYRNNSATLAGLDFSVSSPFPSSGFIGSNILGGGGGGANMQTVEFQFTGGLFNGVTFEFDADTDPQAQSAASTAGVEVTVSLSDGTTFNGNLAADPQNANRIFIEFQ